MGSVGHARDGAQISRLRRGLWRVTRAVIAGGAGDEMAVVEERGVVRAGEEAGLALAWLADREQSQDGLGLWPAGAGRRGRPEGWMARRPVISCGMLTAQVRASWPGRPG